MSAAVRQYRGMAYDEDLVNRLRELLAGESGVVEQRMFGGLAFLIGGHLAVAASGSGGLMLRVEASTAEPMLFEPHVTRVEMRGRPVSGGWLRVADDGIRTKRQLTGFVTKAVAYTRSLPPKG